MIKEARLLALGPFRKDLTRFLPHKSAYYTNAKEGLLVETELFVCTTAQASLDLAELLNVDPTDCSTHEISPMAVDVRDLGKFEDEIEKFIKLVGAEFSFVFSFR